jgi:hypothetical protein
MQVLRDRPLPEPRTPNLLQPNPPCSAGPPSGSWWAPLAPSPSFLRPVAPPLYPAGRRRFSPLPGVGCASAGLPWPAAAALASRLLSDVDWGLALHSPLLYPPTHLQGNLGRAGYTETTRGFWPYTYNTCARSRPTGRGLAGRWIAACAAHPPPPLPRVPPQCHTHHHHHTDLRAAPPPSPALLQLWRRRRRFRVWRRGARAAKHLRLPRSARLQPHSVWAGAGCGPGGARDGLDREHVREQAGRPGLWIGVSLLGRLAWCGGGCRCAGHTKQPCAGCLF